MARTEDLEHVMLQYSLSFMLVFSGIYHVVVSGSTCRILHDTIRLPSGKSGGFIQGAIICFIFKCSGFFCLLKWLFFSFQFLSDVF